MMKPLSDKEMRRWHAIFRLLSLDCALPLWKQMGLNLTEEEQHFVLYAARLAHMIVQDGARNYYDANYAKVANSVELFQSLLVTYKGNDFYQQVNEWCGHDFVHNESLKMSVEESW